MADRNVPRAVLDWERFKDWLSASVHLTHHQLHVVVGLLLFVLAARLLRRPLRSPLPLLPVAVLELVNEGFDFARYYTSGWPWTAHETLVDIALTLAPPCLVVIASRIAAAVRRRAGAPARDEAGQA